MNDIIYFYLDEPLADGECLEEYNRDVEETERRNQELQTRFDKTKALNLVVSVDFHDYMCSVLNLNFRIFNSQVFT